MAGLEGYGLHELVWESCDDVFAGALVASPADAEGRGIALAVRRDGEAADLSGANVYLLCYGVRRGFGRLSGDGVAPRREHDLDADVRSVR